MKDIYIKKGVLLIVQSDNISGEMVGSVIEQLYGASASNVQVIPTITKKNRPSFIFLIDTKELNIHKIQEIILYEIGATGWHRLNTEHCHVAVEVLEKVVEVLIGEIGFQFLIQAKWTPEDPDFYRPEYDCCMNLKQKILNTTGQNIPLKDLHRNIEHVFSKKLDSLIIKT